MGRTVKRPSLTAWIFIGLVAGIAFGAIFPQTAQKMALLGTIFLRMIKAIIAPLLFGTLVVGIAGTGSIKTMGRIGGKAILYFEIVTTLALFIGLAAVNLVKPGVGVALAQGASSGLAQTRQDFSQIVEHIFPTSIIDAMARGDVLQIVVFAFIFGAACAAIGAKARAVVDFCDSLAEVMFRFTNYVMLFAPLGVFGAIAATVGQKGLGVLLNLGEAGGHAVCRAGDRDRRRFRRVGGDRARSHPALCRLRARAVPDRLLHRVERSRASPGARKYGSLRRAETYCRVRVAYRLQLQPGRHHAVSLARLGFRRAGRRHSHAVRHAAGDDADADADQQRRGGNPALRAGDPGRDGRAAFNLPIEGVALLLGIDALLDMARTSVNVLGNCLATAVVARWEGVKFAPELQAKLS